LGQQGSAPSARTVDLQFLVFLRNDIYELLIDETSDRGKEGQILIDWSDREQLKRIILERIQYSLELEFSSFNTAWQTFFVPTVDGIDSFEYFVSRCLMRPRFLIDLVENCISIAVNRGHEKVSADDLRADNEQGDRAETNKDRGPKECPVAPSPASGSRSIPKIWRLVIRHPANLHLAYAVIGRSLINQHRHR
jgi:hypothetical protein